MSRVPPQLKLGNAENRLFLRNLLMDMFSCELGTKKRPHMPTDKFFVDSPEGCFSEDENPLKITSLFFAGLNCCWFLSSTDSRGRIHDSWGLPNHIEFLEQHLSSTLVVHV